MNLETQLINTFFDQAVAAGLAIGGISLARDTSQKRASTYHDLPTGTSQKVNATFLRVDWKHEPDITEIRQLENLFNFFDFTSATKQRVPKTTDEITGELYSLPDEQRDNILLRLTASLLRMFPELSAELGLTTHRLQDE